MLVDGREIAMLKAKECFGELELLYSQPRQATVRALSDVVVCWLLDRDTYRKVMGGISMRKRKMYEDFLKNVKFLQSLTAPEVLQLADALQPRVFQAKDLLIRYGEEGQWFYIIVEGEVEVIGRDAEGSPLKVLSPSSLPSSLHLPPPSVAFSLPPSHPPTLPPSLAPSHPNKHTRPIILGSAIPGLARNCPSCGAKNTTRYRTCA